jgi:hypothetical protein
MKSRELHARPDANKEFGIVHQLNAEKEKGFGTRLRILTPP